MPSVLGDSRFGVQAPQTRGSQVAQRDGAGEAWILGVRRHLPEHVVEDQRGDAPVHMPGRTLECRAQMKVGEHPPIGIMLDRQRRRGRIADPDHGVPPRHAIAAGGVAHPERTVALLGPQLGRRRVDLGPDGLHGIGVDLSTDRRVDELADRLGERLVDGAHAFDLSRGDVADIGELHHLCTRTRSSRGCRVRRGREKHEFTAVPVRRAVDGSPGSPTG